MHKGPSHESGHHPDVTQAQADACCAASERDLPNSSNPAAVTTISVAVLGAGIVVRTISPASLSTDVWRTDALIHSPPVPRHVLLSVFLV